MSGRDHRRARAPPARNPAPAGRWNRVGGRGQIDSGEVPAVAMTTRRDADLFARLLDGPAPDDPDGPRRGRGGGAGRPGHRWSSGSLGRRSRRTPSSSPGCASQLVVAAQERASVVRRTSPAAARPPAAASGAPRTLVIRWPSGALPVAVATVLGFAILVGGLASRALPGDRLYDVKLGIGQAQVRMAGQRPGPGPGPAQPGGPPARRGRRAGGRRVTRARPTSTSR